MTWWMYALISAAAAAFTTIAAKLGMAGISSNLATAIRTCVVLIFAWAIVAFRGELREMGTISPRGSLWLVLSGIGTGVSWLAYFRALQMGPAAGVASVDKSSLVLTVLLAALLLGEHLTLRSALGVGLIVVGTVLMVK